MPQLVSELAGGRDLQVVWRNELGGLTFVLGHGDERCFVKWASSGSGLDCVAEAARLMWLAPFSRVPRVLGAGADETASWLITTPLPGESAISERWKREPAIAVAAIGRGLRHLHDHAPVVGCPYSWSVESRVNNAHHQVAIAATNPSLWHPCHQTLSTQAALAALDAPPAIDRLVVCHGDACAPNSLLTDDGDWSGHVDLGALGVADRWADLAIATWSTEWNYGPGWEHALLDAYGIEPDPGRSRYYRLLWDLD
ncbi:MAG TPA: aminoglycoside 3'-phosphotransferase [Acidimicrobiales bacterium]|nr:aminoglycoside 3'-phosphotransferase [Acidimicrobiales bacterium]